MERKFDPILVQVVKNELATVNEEMAIAVYRTGRSAIVQVGDFATPYDAQGRVVGEGAAPFQIGIFMVVLELGSAAGADTALASGRGSRKDTGRRFSREADRS